MGTCAQNYDRALLTTIATYDNYCILRGVFVGCGLEFNYSGYCTPFLFFIAKVIRFTNIWVGELQALMLGTYGTFNYL